MTIHSWVSSLKRLVGDQLRKDIRGWLCPPDPSVNYNIGCKAQYADTTMWITENGAFNNWKASGSLIWIHGKRAFAYLLLDSMFN